jgi:hypothetical protein
MADRTHQDFVQPFYDFLRSVATTGYGDAVAMHPDLAADQAAFEEMKAHILHLYRNVSVTASYRDEEGTIFDCIQNMPSPVEASPESIPVNQMDNAPIHRCPEGSFPMRRLTLEELTRFRSLEHFLGKLYSTKKLRPELP